jgi:hypothetical protein
VYATLDEQQTGDGYTATLTISYSSWPEQTKIP